MKILKKYPEIIFSLAFFIPMFIPSIILSLLGNAKINIIAFSIGLFLWGIITFGLFSDFRKERYWKQFHEKYGKKYVKLSIPFKFYANFDARFFLYDEDGNVLDFAISKEEAIKKHNETGLYITRVIDKDY